ncbi:MAG: glycoside hydrolase family 13 protein [Eubacteriales bacterium]
MLRIHRDSDGHMLTFPMEKQAEGDTHRFSCTLAMRALCGAEEDGLFYYCYDVYYPERCVTYGGESPSILTACSEQEKRQLLVYRMDYRTPQWLRGGIIYHIFVDRFCRAGICPLKPGTVLNRDWDNGIPQFGAYPGAELANNEFFGGTLYGVVQKLDYIASLGVSCIYLSPVFDAASNHKYDTGDYEHVDSMFGGDDALDLLLREAAKREIRVILDGVFNHTGADSRYFNRYGHYADSGAYQSPQSPYYPWYTFSEYPDRYDCWWGVPILPKVRCDEPSYREYILGENGIVARWMRRGVGGWRLDVADELSDGFLDAFRAWVHAAAPDAVIYGEVWEDATDKIAYSRRRRYLRGAQLDSVMNYPLRSAVIAYLRDGDCVSLTRCVNTVYRRYPKQSADLLMNFLSTHDTMRILTALAGEKPDGHTNAELSVMRLNPEQRTHGERLVKLAYRLVAAMPGVPCIFYGDEAGVEGYGDPFCRAPFPWGRESENLESFFRETGRIHHENPVFREGYVKLLHCTPESAAVLRYDGVNPSVLLLLNRSEHPLSYALSCSVEGLDTQYTGDHPVLEAESGGFYRCTDSMCTAEVPQIQKGENG